MKQAGSQTCCFSVLISKENTPSFLWGHWSWSKSYSLSLHHLWMPNPIQPLWLMINSSLTCWRQHSNPQNTLKNLGKAVFCCQVSYVTSPLRGTYSTWFFSFCLMETFVPVGNLCLLIFLLQSQLFHYIILSNLIELNLIFIILLPSSHVVQLYNCLRGFLDAFFACATIWST